MPDSWIDREELEALVGEFASLRGKGRRKPPVPQVASYVPEYEMPADRAETGETTAAQPFSTEDVSPTVADAPEEIHVLQLPSPVLDDDQKSNETTEVEPEDIADSEHSSTELLVQAIVSEETARKVPSFLEAGSEFEFDQQSNLSARDTDKALLALVEARSKVDQSGLIRTPKGAEPPANKDLESEALNAEILEKLSPVTEVPTAEDEHLQLAGVSLFTRLESYVRFVEQDPRVLAVLVCD